MARDTKDWNFDRIHSAQALIADCQNDMMRCLYQGRVSDVVQERMLERLKAAADQLSKITINNQI